MKNYSKSMRQSPLFMRNGFETKGQWDIPVVTNQDIDLSNVELIGYSDTRANDNATNKRKGVHFFIDDYRFESIYKNPKKSLEKLSQYAFLLTPDYSTYCDMNQWRQLESVAHSRWCGAYWQNQGLKVIPTISWSTPNSYRYCYDGIEQNGIVAIGMIGCKRNRYNFMRGYNEMLSRLNPKAIICFGKPFQDMKGNLIVVDYIDSRKVVR